MNDTSHITETVTPTDQAAVAEAVRRAVGQRRAVYPIGGGTMLSLGVKPTRPGVALSLHKLNRVIDYPAADLTITVEAGMTLSELGKCLTAQRQRLPIDVSQPDRATIGGAVAVNAAGPRRYAYGAMRDYVLGLTAVDGAGAVFSAGGRVVKNAAGYNMCRLMTGSLGTLGIVTQVTLMVRPLPDASVFLVGELPDFNVAEKLLADMVTSPARPAAIELVAGRDRHDDPVLGPVLEGHVGRLYVGFEGPAAEVDWMVEQLRAGWAAAGATAAMLIPTGRAESLWRRLTDVPADLQIGVLPSAMIATIAKALEICPNCAIQAHAGNGVIRMALGDERISVFSQLRAMAKAADGKMIALRNLDGMAISAADVWGSPGPEIRIMQAIKDRFDPENILNPGRFVF